MTKEHFHPKWARPYINTRFKSSGHSVSLGGQAPTTGKLHRPGDTHSQTLRVLCHNCNNVEMGGIQDAIKPVLLPLIQGAWHNPLSLDEQTLIATWATMTTIVLESAHPESQTVPREERHQFAVDKVPPPRWTVWVGKHRGQQSGVHNHVAWLHGSDMISPPDKCQTTGWVLGKLFILTLRAPWNTGNAKDDFAKSLAAEWGIRCVWPANTAWSEPTNWLGDTQWQQASRAIGAKFGIAPRIVGAVGYAVNPN